MFNHHLWSWSLSFTDPKVSIRSLSIIGEVWYQECLGINNHNSVNKYWIWINLILLLCKHKKDYYIGSKNTYLSEVTSCIPSNLEIFWGLGYLNLAGKVISPKLTSKASHQTESHLNSNVLLIIYETLNWITWCSWEFCPQAKSELYPSCCRNPKYQCSPSHLQWDIQTWCK